jgi:hypothetical protein
LVWVNRPGSIRESAHVLNPPIGRGPLCQPLKKMFRINVPVASAEPSTRLLDPTLAMHSGLERPND